MLSLKNPFENESGVICSGQTKPIFGTQKGDFHHFESMSKLEVSPLGLIFHFAPLAMSVATDRGKGFPKKFIIHLFATDAKTLIFPKKVFAIWHFWLETICFVSPPMS